MSDEVNWQQLAEGFRLERNIMQEMAMKAKAEVERWKKKAELHAFEIQKRIVNAHGQGYEAGRREGLLSLADWLEGQGQPGYAAEVRSEPMPEFVCKACKQTVWRPKRRKFCSQQCNAVDRHENALVRDRTCRLCHRTLPCESFRQTNRTKPDSPRKRSSRCIDCERVLFRTAHELGQYSKQPYKRRVRVEDPVKQDARHKLQAAVRNGLIQRKPCIDCGNPKSDAHHHDYSKPYDVEWLCRRHHMRRHRLPVSTPFTEQDARVYVAALIDSPKAEGEETK